MMKKYDIEVDCANCAAKMEAACQKIEGIDKISINFMTQKMTVEFAEGQDAGALLKTIEKTCKKVDRDFELKA